MPQPDPFFAFPRAHAERIELAACDLIKADVVLGGWCDGRAFRLPDPLMEPDGALPVFLLSVETEVTPVVLNNEVQVQSALGIVAVYEERRAFLSEDAHRSVKSLEHRLRLVFASSLDSRYLKVPRYVHPDTGVQQKLVERVAAFGTVDYGSLERPQPASRPEDVEDGEGDDVNIARYATFGVIHEYHCNAETLEKVGFTPPYEE